MDHPLLPGEELVMTSDDGNTILTNMRLIVTGSSYSCTSFLEEISSIEVTKHGDGGHLLGGILITYLLEGLFLDIENYYVFLFTIITTPLIALMVWWYFHRARISVILKNGRKVNISVNQSSFNQIVAFTWRIQSERNARLVSLTPKP